MSGPDDEIHTAPEMRMIAAIVQQPEQVICTGSRDHSFVSVGAGFIPGAGPAVYLGLHQPGQPDVIGALFGQHLAGFMEELRDLSVQIVNGAFDAPQVAQ